MIPSNTARQEKLIEEGNALVMRRTTLIVTRMYKLAHVLLSPLGSSTIWVMSPVPHFLCDALFRLDEKILNPIRNMYY
jgi:hypothetical protein